MSMLFRRRGLLWLISDARYIYFDGYPHDVFVAHKGSIFTTKAKCHRILQTNDKPHVLEVDLCTNDWTVKV